VAILTSRYRTARDILHMSSTKSLDTWTEVLLPHRFMSLTTYRSRFVLVGGRLLPSNEPTNVILTSTTGLEWESSLPPMPTKRYMASSVSTRFPEALVVAGGKDSQYMRLKVVEVLLRDKWTSVDFLPSPASSMHSTIHDGKIFFMKDGEEKATAYYCSCSSLISSITRSSEDTAGGRSLWKQLEAPREKSTAGTVVSFASCLLSIDGDAIVRAYASTINSWVEAASVGVKLESHAVYVAASRLPTREIIYIHEDGGIHLVHWSSKNKYRCAVTFSV